jgi:hypothetical protein
MTAEFAVVLGLPVAAMVLFAGEWLPGQEAEDERASSVDR